MMRLIEFLKHWWPSMLTLGVVLYATLASDPVGAEELPSIPHIDKAIHAIMMGGLTGAIAFDYQRMRKHRCLNYTVMLTIAVGVMAFGLCDEMMQSMLNNGRGSEDADFAADCVGALAAIFLAPPAIYKVLKIKTNG